MTSLFPALTNGPADGPALRFGERSLTYGRTRAPRPVRTAGTIHGARRVAVWATPDAGDRRRRRRGAAGRGARRTAQPEVRARRSSGTSWPTAPRRWCWPTPDDRTPARPRGLGPPRRRRARHRPVPPRGPRRRRRPGPGRLHLRHHRPAQGRRHPAPGDRRDAGRAGRRLAVDRRRRPRPRTAAVPCARPGPGHPRPAAARRFGAPPGPVQHRGRRPRAERRRDHAVRRADDVPPDRRGAAR